MPGKRAKILSIADVGDLAVYASCTRHRLRNTVMVLLSAKAGLRAGEMKKNPEAIVAFNRAMKETIDYMNQDAERARREVVAYSGLDAPLVREMPMIAWDYNVRLEKWQQVVDMMRESGELQKQHRAEEYLSAEIKPYIVK
jgi:ABC-type nitrate/sulfonate/bicarbonate transport system substrate-binding protein